MLATIISILLAIAGFINFAPLMGILSTKRLTALYGVTINDPNLLILMKHRALLFGIVGGFMLYAVFSPPLQPAAFVMGFISMIGFIIITWGTGGYNPLLKKVAIIDLIAIFLLAIAALLSITTQL
ncbi:MAG: hypothetical protein KDE51_27030 [Anaerolineales bacterium]|nr:hypothetical protein [Anaerolineales bacterium]